MDDLIQQISKVPLPQRIAALVLAVVTIFVLTYFIFVSPKQAEIARHEARIQQLDSDLIQKEAIARHLPRYRVEVERLKQRLNEALTLLPNEAEIPELLQKIAARVEQSDCEMESFEPQGELASGFYAKIPVKMSIRGNFHSILVFFDKVSKLSRIVNVTNIELTSPTVENKKVVLNADFMATTFKFVDRDPNAPSTGFGQGGT
ncbi:MAG TPA: type 4a pilus biogenesis protein PilO [Myxococcales bacterium LLY-WYZ-16_1]|jgi:type IV pilus assembly protein PilO|nr:type 4a pilus biogenesis protein PilO [Myxococcales bacterium LLY-WYZ-16_1]